MKLSIKLSKPLSGQRIRERNGFASHPSWWSPLLPSWNSRPPAGRRWGWWRPCSSCRRRRHGVRLPAAGSPSAPSPGRSWGGRAPAGSPPSYPHRRGTGRLGGVASPSPPPGGTSKALAGLWKWFNPLNVIPPSTSRQADTKSEQLTYFFSFNSQI